MAGMSSGEESIFYQSMVSHSQTLFEDGVRETVMGGSEEEGLSGQLVGGDGSSYSNKRLNCFMKRTHRGKVRKVLREVYLRDDIGCGIRGCFLCEQGGDVSAGTCCLDVPTGEDYLLVLDTNVLLHQIDFVCDEDCIDNVVLLTTVLQEVRNRNRQTYSRVRALCRGCGEDESAVDSLSRVQLRDGTAARRRFYVFSNEFCGSTFVQRRKDETTNDRNDRAIRTGALWFKNHVEHMRRGQLLTAADEKLTVLLLTNDTANKDKAIQDGLDAMTVYEYVEMLRLKNPKKYGSVGEKLASLTVSEARSGGEVHCSVSSEDRRPVYAAHWPESAIRASLKARQLVMGTIRMTRYDEGYVALADEGGEIKIQGMENVNRAIDGDLVAVEPTLESDDNAQRVGHKRSKVVGIVKRNWKEYFGSFRPLAEIRERSTKSAFLKTERVFVPFNKNIPFIVVKTRHSQDLDKKRISVIIDSWDRYSEKPHGHWLRIIGDIGDKNTESNVILNSFGVITREFSASVLRCLPAADWKIPDDELAVRLDFRDELVCSIDPPGCKDIDDALSAKVLPNGNFQIGVHIADVTHFVKAGTAIDKEAAERCTTVYLVERRTDMLPGLLTTDLCSLVGGSERLAFSVLWEMTPNAEVVSKSFHKTVIKSSAALTYAEAQMRIDNQQDKSPLTESIRTLGELAKKLRSARLDRGALELASAEVGSV
eukprot:GHVQ01023629.1.p1 GENE.GHVQ01023629.1~~GHVQ01023629.1.p1  ORF type:complete len:708 (+),score=95.68 GHVQ01023629.1:517-2640(+)